MPLADSPIVKPEVVFIEDLLEEIAKGTLRVPRFQRPYIWRPSDMLDLFDSIYKGYPIGSPLLWQTSEDVESLDEVGPLETPHPDNRVITYILDGHQRLATLFGGLHLLEDYPRSPAQKDWRWWIWFDLKKRIFTHVPKGEPSPELLPLRAVLRTVDFLGESRRIQRECSEEADELIKEAEHLAQKIKNYKVATTRIIGGTLKESVEIFSRLNTLGRSMSPDQMVSALTYRPGKGGIHLAERIDIILERLSAYHFGHINRLAVFRSILAAGKTDIQTSDWETLAKKLGSNVSIAVDAAEVALESAARFLHEDLAVPGDKFLPYSFQMVLLSEFFHRCPNPNETQKQILRKWFWVTSLSGWFAGANTTHIRYALDEMREFAKDETKKLKVMPLDDPARPFPLRFDARSARVRALCIFMLKMKPLDLVSGKPLKVEETFGEFGMSHIFSHRHNPLVSNPANRILIEKKPGRSVKDQLTALADDLFTNQDEREKKDKILESHFIPQEAFEALRRNDANGFIESRARHIAQCERDFMESLDITLPKDTYPEESDYVEYDADADTDF